MNPIVLTFITLLLSQAVFASGVETWQLARTAIVSASPGPALPSANFGTSIGVA